MIYGLKEEALATRWEKSVGEKFIEVADYLTEKGKTSPVLCRFEDGDISLTWRQDGMDFSILAWVDTEADGNLATADPDDAEEDDDTEVDFVVIVNGVIIRQYGWESIDNFNQHGFIDDYRNSPWKSRWEEACREAWNHAIAEGTNTMIIPCEDIDPILADLDTVDLAVRAERIYEYFLGDEDEEEEEEGEGEVIEESVVVPASPSEVKPEGLPKAGQLLDKIRKPLLIGAFVIALGIFVGVPIHVTLISVPDPVRDMIDRTNASGSDVVLVQSSDEWLRSFTVEQYLGGCEYGVESFCENDKRQIEICIEKSYILEFDQNYPVEGELIECGFYSDHKRDGALEVWSSASAKANGTV